MKPFHGGEIFEIFNDDDDINDGPHRGTIS